jgi:hypothetical protein
LTCRLNSTEGGTKDGKDGTAMPFAAFAALPLYTTYIGGKAASKDGSQKGVARMAATCCLFDAVPGVVV